MTHLMKKIGVMNPAADVSKKPRGNIGIYLRFKPRKNTHRIYGS